MNKNDITVLIPTLNEGATIGEVVQEFKERDYDVLVIDGGSEDDTQEKARKKGARVIEQMGEGKGQAVQEAIEVLDSEYIVMIDGDGTYLPEEVDNLLDPLKRGYEHVLGDRISKKNREAFTRLNYIGNKILNQLFKFAHGKDLNDILTGYRVFKRESVEALRLDETGFGIEAEMTAEALKRGQKLTSVPITYRKRPEESDTKLRPFRDGSWIALTIYRMAKTSNPLFYFGAIGFLLTFAGLISGGYVIYERYINNITHELLAVLTALLVISGLQFFIFASLSDFLIEIHRDEMDAIEKIKDKK